MKTILIRLTTLGQGLALAASVFAGQVTFEVNMSAQVALGNFDPTSDGVFVAGDPINAWSTSASPLAPSPGDANIWTGTFEVTGTEGNTGQYKYVLITAGGTTTWEGNVGSGGGTGNRTFTLSDADQTLPVVFFNNVADLGAVSLGAVTGGRLTLSWTAGPRVRLQTSPEANAGNWQDVPDTLGQSSATVAVDQARAFHRLVGP